MGYEFNSKDSQIISRVADKFLIGAILMGFGGLMAMISAFQQRNKTNSGNFLLWIIEAFTQLGSAYYLTKPRSNLKNVATTQGKDIEELLEGMNNISSSFFVIFFFVLVATVSTLLHLVV